MTPDRAPLPAPTGEELARASERAARARGARRHRVAYLVSHPIQYQAPLLRALAREPRLDLEVLFLSDLSVGEFRHEAFRHDHAWDVPLLEGYAHRFLDAWGRTDRLSSLRPFTRDLVTTLRAGGYDALWIHGWGHQAHLRALAAARRLGLPVLLRAETRADTSDPAPGARWRRPVRRLLHRWVLRRASAVLAIGKANRRFYERAGYPAERTFAMPYAVDNARFREGAERARATRTALRDELGLPPHAPVVLYGSRLVKHKGPADLLTAFRELGPKRGDARLVFVGDGPERERLEALAGSDRGDRVHFVGFRNQTELPRYYDLCDVFCLPSRFEPWGLVVNEAMSAGRPVIASDRVGAAEDLITHGENGFLFPAGRTELLAHRLEEALADRERLRDMGRLSAERVERFSFDEDRRGLLRALDAVVGR